MDCKKDRTPDIYKVFALKEYIFVISIYQKAFTLYKESCKERSFFIFLTNFNLFGKSLEGLIKFSYRNLISLSQKSYENILIAFLAQTYQISVRKFYKTFKRLAKQIKISQKNKKTSLLATFLIQSESLLIYTNYKDILL